jgi:hypothetical protein
LAKVAVGAIRGLTKKIWRRFSVASWNNLLRLQHRHKFRYLFPGIQIPFMKPKPPDHLSALDFSGTDAPECFSFNRVVNSLFATGMPFVSHHAAAMSIADQSLRYISSRDE